MSELPGLLGQIADIAGIEIAFRVADSHGGTVVSIPPRAVAGHWLTDLVGMEQADEICRGLATLDAEGRLKGIQKELMPLGPAGVLKNARWRARQALNDGKSTREAARLAGLHERTIWRMKKDADDEDQFDLFRR